MHNAIYTSEGDVINMVAQRLDWSSIRASWLLSTMLAGLPWKEPGNRTEKSRNREVILSTRPPSSRKGTLHQRRGLEPDLWCHSELCGTGEVTSL